MSDAPAFEPPSYIEEEEIWFTNPNMLTLHGRVKQVRPFYTSDPTSPHMYVVRDDSGMLHMTKERYMERPDTIPVINAERFLRRCYETLMAHHQEGRWVESCLRDLDDALYELAKPKDDQ